MRREGLIYLLLALITLALYLPVTRCDFVNYDDQIYVTQNLHVQAGLMKSGLAWAFTTGDASNWHPLTWLSHMLDCQLYGLKAGGHHLINVVFHIENALLLFEILRRTTGAMWRSAMVAALFAWHPMHVESVAWVSERKDVLSAFFWLLTILFYVEYAKKPSAKRYLFCLLFFALGLLSKPMVVTLPFALLLLDFWPLKRSAECGVRSAEPKQGANVNSLGIGWSKLVLEKIPFLVLSAGSCVATYFVQRKGGAVASLGNLPLSVRLENVPIAYCSYVLKLIWPTDLCVLYPLAGNWPMWEVVVAVLSLVVVTAGVVVQARKQQWLFTGWFWFLGTLVPVIGLVQVGSQAMADRYSYLPSIGLFTALVWGVEALTRKWPAQEKLTGALAGAILVACCVCTTGQLQYWKNSVALFSHTVQLTQNNALAYSYLGDAQISEGNFQPGLENLYEAARLQPDYAPTQGRIGVALSNEGKPAEAINYYRHALDLDPNLPEALNNLAWILAASEDAAIRNGNEAVQLAERACSMTHYQAPLMIGTLADAYAEAGRFPDAIVTAEKARALALSIDANAVAAKNEELLELYRSGKAFHESRH